MRRLDDASKLTVVLITHKFREVEKFAQDVTVLRGGRLAGSLSQKEASKNELAGMMFGSNVPDRPGFPAPAAANETVPYLRIADLHADGERGTPALNGVDIVVRP